MHPEAINAATRRVFGALSQNQASAWYLAGGTALAIQLGHRISVDLDWFSPEDFPHRASKTALASLGQFELTGEEEGTIHGVLDGVRVSFFHYPYPLLYPCVQFEKANLADVRDIAAMKLDAISSRGSKKDFIDLYFLLQQYSFAELWDIFERKYAAIKFNKLHMLKSLTYFENADNEPMPVMLRDVAWDTVKKTITQTAHAALNDGSQ